MEEDWVSQAGVKSLVAEEVIAEKAVASPAVSQHNLSGRGHGGWRPSHTCYSWRDQLLSLQKDHNDWGERKVGKENWRKASFAVCPKRQKDHPQPSGTPSPRWGFPYQAKGIPKASSAKYTSPLVLQPPTAFLLKLALFTLAPITETKN